MNNEWGNRPYSTSETWATAVQMKNDFYSHVSFSFLYGGLYTSSFLEKEAKGSLQVNYGTLLARL